MYNILKKIYRKYRIARFRSNPLLYIYEAYLTIRYVDQYKQFPAIRFNNYVKIKISKKNAILIINELLVFEGWINGTGTTKITLKKGSELFIDGEFGFGDGVNVCLMENARLVLKGKHLESASGITANSIILVKEYVEIGKDCIIAWDTFITDSDWHGIDRKNPTKRTLIGNHVWIGVGVKILKGSIVGDNSIITANTVITNKKYPIQSLISGNLGSVVKSNIPHWHRDMDARIFEDQT
jgi:acetyltransferase-like isoleucine patch superfamily enzyme